MVDIIQKSSRLCQWLHLKRNMPGHWITFVEHWPGSSWAMCLACQWNRSVMLCG